METKKKLLIVGGGGFVGGHLAEAAKDRWDVHIIDREFKLGLSNSVVWHLIDILNYDHVNACIQKINPNVLIIAAAISNIDFAEQYWDEASEINIQAAQNIAETAQQIAAKVVYLSSDAVYDGQSDCTIETDPLNPVNFYGKTKMDGEDAVLSVCPEAIIVRLSLVLGRSYTQGNSFVDKLASKLASGESVEATEEEIRTPIDVETLAHTILALIEKNAVGIFHIGSRESMNRYQITKTLAEVMGFSNSLVTKNNGHNSHPKRAPRHKKGILSVQKIEDFLGIQMLPILETIHRGARQVK